MDSARIPFMNDCLAGAHTGVGQYALSNTIPSFANLSILGVRTARIFEQPTQS
ncbi:MAG TPA: hypothetical protein PKJ65_03360 [Clostridia bacterium]|nr:hypothetical protein [Clostridia bacterium]